MDRLPASELVRRAQLEAAAQAKELQLDLGLRFADEAPPPLPPTWSPSAVAMTPRSHAAAIDARRHRQVRRGLDATARAEAARGEALGRELETVSRELQALRAGPPSSRAQPAAIEQTLDGCPRQPTAAPAHAQPG
jgi:hypothetical protein